KQSGSVRSCCRRLPEVPLLYRSPGRRVGGPSPAGRRAGRRPLPPGGGRGGVCWGLFCHSRCGTPAVLLLQHLSPPLPREVCERRASRRRRVRGRATRSIVCVAQLPPAVWLLAAWLSPRCAGAGVGLPSSFTFAVTRSSIWRIRSGTRRSTC